MAQLNSSRIYGRLIVDEKINNLTLLSNTEGYTISGGDTTIRSLTISGGNISLTGGSAGVTLTIPNSITLGNVASLTYTGDTTKFLRDDGTWQVVSTTTPLANSTTIGGIKIGYTSSGNNIALELDSNDKAFISLPNTIPTITLNGAVTTSPNFYAPTSLGSAGEALVVNSTGDGFSYIDLSDIITSEQDTLTSVTDRNATTTNTITIGGLKISTDLAFTKSNVQFNASNWTYFGTTITVTKILHGLSSGDYVYIEGAVSSTNPPNGGPFVITVVSGNQFYFSSLFEPSGTATGTMKVTAYRYVGVNGTTQPAVVVEGKIIMVSDLILSPSSLIIQNGVDALTAQYLYEKIPSGAHIITTSTKGAFKIKATSGSVYDVFVTQNGSGDNVFKVDSAGKIVASDLNITGPYITINTGVTGEPENNMISGIKVNRGTSNMSGVYWKEDIDRFTAYNTENGEKVIAQDGDTYDGGLWN
jgi:predicted heme/steroid binding protein